MTKPREDVTMKSNEELLNDAAELKVQVLQAGLSMQELSFGAQYLHSKELAEAVNLTNETMRRVWNDHPKTLQTVVNASYRDHVTLDDNEKMRRGVRSMVNRLRSLAAWASRLSTIPWMHSSMEGLSEDLVEMHRTLYQALE